MTIKAISLAPIEVRALLDGHASSIFRPMRQPAFGCYWAMNGNGDKALHLADDPNVPGGLSLVLWDPADCLARLRGEQENGDHRMACPFGKPGDMLRVVEVWNQDGGLVSYLADGDWIADYCDGARKDWARRVAIGLEPRWQDPLMMPDEISRLYLRLISIDVWQVNAEWQWVLGVEETSNA